MTGVELTVYAPPIFLTAVFTAWSAVLLWRQRIGTESTQTQRLSNYAQLLVLVMITLWALGQLVTVSTTGVAPKLFGVYLTLQATVWTSVAWFLFGLLYCGREQWVTRRTVSLLAIGPVLAAVGVATNGLHELVVSDSVVRNQGRYMKLHYQNGPGLWLGALYNWPMNVVTIVFLIGKFLRSRNVYRKIAFINIVGGIVLLGGMVLSSFKMTSTPAFTLSVLMFFAVSVLIALSLVSYRYLQLLPVERLLSLIGNRWRNLTPMARDRVIEEMQSGLLVLDHNNRIVDCNPMGRRIVGADDRRVVGDQLPNVIEPQLLEQTEVPFLHSHARSGQHRGVWVTTPTGERRSFDILVTGLGPEDAPTGRAALINDVTDRERHKEKLEERTRELERKNEQLEEFANIASHDLRNPLTQAKGYLDLAKDDPSTEEYFEKVEESHDRMETIISDVLTLARQGRAIAETEPVSLRTVATDAWATVETNGATLDLNECADGPVDDTDDAGASDGTLEIEADPQRLQRLFENCFRNAMEHGGDTVTVTVGGSSGDGFFIADDGSGIPEDEREEVLQSGYTTADSGTGFGLAIVSEIATAHGWSVDVSEAASGGAKFEFNQQDQSAVE